VTRPHPEGRPLQIRVRVSQTERDTVRQAARIAGLGVSEWVREALIECALEEIEGEGR
jgi:uncharacterized protein (DUF1778 family)